MNIVTIEDHVPILDLNGRLDERGARIAQREIRRLINDDRTRFIIDLTNVSFIDEHGLAVLDEAIRLVRRLEDIIVLVLPASIPARRALFADRIQRIALLAESVEVALEMAAA